MKFIIDNQIFEKFPGLNIGLVVVKGIDNTGKDEDILNLIKQRESEIKQSFSLREKALPRSPDPDVYFPGKW